MATFEDFLNEKNITIKRKYTDTYPAKTVGHSARVRNKIIEALKDGKITVDEFNDIVASHSTSPKRWSRNNKRFFKIEEDGVSLSGYGRKVLKTIQPVNEGSAVNEDALKDAIEKEMKANDGRFKTDFPSRELRQILNTENPKDLPRSAKKALDRLKKKYKIKESVDEGLNKSDIAYQLAIDYTGRTKPKITKLNKKRIQIKYGYKISPQKVIDSIKAVHPEVELKHVEWSNSISGGGFHIFDILESKVNEFMVKPIDHDEFDWEFEINDPSNKKLYKELTKNGIEFATSNGQLTIMGSGDMDNAVPAIRILHKFGIRESKNVNEKTLTDYGLSRKFGAALDALPSKKFNDKDVTALAKKHKEDVEAALTYAKSAFGWLWKESNEVMEGRAKATQMLKDVAKGSASEVEGIKLSKEMASCFLDWLKGSTYGKKFSDLPFEKLFTASFNWGLDRYIQPGCKDEFKELKTKAKAMKESTIYTDFTQFVNESLNEKSIKDWFTANIDSFKDEKEYMKAGKKAGFSKKELETTMDDFEQGGEDYLESHDKSVDEAKFVKDFNRDVLKAKTKEEVSKIYPNAEFFIGKLTHFFGQLEDNLFFKADYIKGKKEFEIKSVYSQKGRNYVHLYLNEATEPEKKIHETFESFLDAEPINEKLKSSKLRGLLSMKKGNANLLKAIYGFSKIRLDQIKDEQIIDIDPKQGKKAEGLVVYYTTQEKENPYVDRSSNSSWTQAWNFKFPANTILGIGMGKDVAYMTQYYDRKSGRIEYSLTTNNKFSKGLQDVGINKKYRGWDSTGVYNVKRMIDLADAAFVINTAALPDSTDLRIKRGEQKRGATALMDPKEFKNQNMKKYKAILQQRASSLPIDDLVVGAIEEVAKIMADGVKKREVNKYGEFIMGTGSDGRAYRISDLNNFTNNLMQDYERWARAADTVANAKGGDDEDDVWAVKYYSDEMKKYAKDIKDRLGKLKKRNLAW